MRLTKITGQNVKGRNFDIELSPATLLCGGNFAGKSAVIAAIRFGMAGYLPPPVGKLPSSIYAALAGNPEDAGQLSVTVHTIMDNQGRLPMSYETRLVKTARGGVSTVGGIPGQMALPSVLVDPKTFFALSGPARVQAIFEACDVKLEPAIIAAKIQTAAPTTFPVARRTVVIRSAIDRSKALSAAHPPHIALGKLIDEQKELLKNVKATGKTQSAVIQAINWEGEVPMDVSEYLAEALQAQSAAERAESDLLKQAHAAKDWVSKRSRLDSDVAKLQADIELNTWDQPPVPWSDSEEISLVGHKRELQNLVILNARKQSKRESLQARIRQLRTPTQGAPKCPICGGPAADALDDAELELSSIGPDYDLEPFQKLIATQEARKKKAGEDAIRFQRDFSLVSKLTDQIRTLKSGWAQEGPLAPSPGELAAASSIVKKRQNAVLLIRESAVRWEAYQQTSSKREAAEKAMLELTCDEAVLASIIDVLRTLMKDVVETAFTSVLAYARHFTDGILNSPLEYIEELGRRVSAADRAMGCTAPIGSWISHESFSGTEEAIAYAAFSVAIAMKSPFRLVVIDELGRLEQVTKDKLMVRMAELVKAGKIDQFIGVDTLCHDYDGFTTVRLSDPSVSFHE